MSANNRAVDVAVIGVGRMGRHHARVYADLPDANLVAVVDADEDRRETIADELGCQPFCDVDELLASNSTIAAASIAVPTVHHVPVAAPLLQRGVACLIEKPLAADTAEAKVLVDLAERLKVPVQVGHTERFNPAVRAVAAMGITPRFIEVDRISPMTFRSLDVGVVMDMMIHDLDIVLMFAGAALRRVDAAGVAVLGEYEDVVNARLVFESGCVANLTASRLALKTERKMRVFSEQAYVSLDYQKRKGVVIRRSGNEDALSRVRQQISEGVDLTKLDYSQLVQVDELTMQMPHGCDDPLTAELISFLDSVRGDRQPQVDARAGYAAVDAAQRVIDAVGQHRWEGLPQARV